jgi:hypothetical protein
MMDGAVGLAVPSGTDFLTVNNSLVTTAFGSAECQCASATGNPDINLEIKLTKQLDLMYASNTVEVWVGDSSCTNATSRTSSTNTTCEKIVSGRTGEDFTINSKIASTSGIHYALKANAVIDPIEKTCSVATAGASQSNGVYVFIGNDPSAPVATCFLALNERLQGPDAVIDPAASSGDGAIELSWTVPSSGAFAPAKFQVLCSDDCGNPCVDSTSTQVYSVCVNGVLSRRDLTSGGSTTTPTDGGTSTSTDMAALVNVPELRSAQRSWSAVPNATGCAPDGGGGAFPDSGLGPLTNLDTRFIATSEIGPSTSSTRITGLTNNALYHFVILSIDNYGNATPSARIDATPQPTEDLWRRYRAAGGQGSCFIATAAFGSYESRWVWVLRDFRDVVLLEHDWGRRFVGWYYERSPRTAAYIAEHGWARALTRLALLPVIAGAWVWLYVPAWEKAFFLTLLLAFAFRKRIAARLRRGTAA